MLKYVLLYKLLSTYTNIYIYKEFDCANIRMNSEEIQFDEIRNYMNSRYISASEAM